MLTLRDLHAGYGDAPVLTGVDLDIPAGRITALLGRNGSGRSTLCKAVMGLIPARGTIALDGQNLAGLPPHQIARRGVGYVPEARDIFPGLTVGQNLALGLQPGQRDGQGPWSSTQMFQMFPNLAERADVDASRLSGGEQQMLAIARTLMGAPKVLLVDEPTEGLAPHMTQTVRDVLVQIAGSGTAVLLVEQKLTIAMAISDSVAVMGQGRIRFTGTPVDLDARADVRRDWLKVAAA